LELLPKRTGSLEDGSEAVIKGNHDRWFGSLSRQQVRERNNPVMAGQEAQMRRELPGSGIDRQPAGKVAFRVLTRVVHEDFGRLAIQTDHQPTEADVIEQYSYTDQEPVEDRSEQTPPEPGDRLHEMGSSEISRRFFDRRVRRSKQATLRFIKQVWRHEWLRD
jgi:hypothetical protein